MPNNCPSDLETGGSLNKQETVPIDFNVPINVDVDYSGVDGCMNVENTTVYSCVRVKGRLRENIGFWQSIGASRWLLDIIEKGYYLPFIDMPAKMDFPNHNSTVKELDFVTKEIEKLLVSGALVEVEAKGVRVCNPLGVVHNNSAKHRLILDLRYVNKHLRTCQFQYEDIRTAAELFGKGDWFIKFDYTSGYHHIEIFSEHTQFLGCSWLVNGCRKFYKFTVLPFGLSTGPYVFTKMQRALIKHWRGQGLRIFTYLDDGAAAESTLEEARRTSNLVQQVIKQSGFLAQEQKCQWEPTQCGELLGFVMDLRTGTFRVPERRVQALQQALQDTVASGFKASARSLSRLTGMLVSMGLAIGPVVRLWTRGLYREILQAHAWDSVFKLSEEAQREVEFWKENFSNSGYPMWSPSPKIEVLTYSDASDTGWGGFSVQIGEHAAVGSWSEEESQGSSTLRELKAARLVLESLAPMLQGKEVLHRTDNKNTERILSVGSRKKELHQEAVMTYKLCQANNIRLSVEWLSRDQNQIADELSRREDANDYMLDPSWFKALEDLWGPYTVDRFASGRTKQLPRYCSRYLNPGCEVVDAFTASWTGENNWLFPPPYLVPRVLQHMAAGGEEGTLVVPEWPSAPWWPLLVTKQGSWKTYIKDSKCLQPYKGIFIPGSAASANFALNSPNYNILALRLRFACLQDK